MDADAANARATILDARRRRASDWSRSLRALHEAMVEAVAGEAGLAAVAELAADALAAPVAIVAPRLGGAWVAPAAHLTVAELDVLAGEAMDRVADPRVRAPAALLAEAPIVIAGEAVGVVALLGADDAAVAPHATKVLHLAAMAALTGAVVADVRREAEHRLRGSAEEALVLAQRLSARLRPGADVRMPPTDTAPVARSRAAQAGSPLAIGAESSVGASGADREGGAYRLLLRVMASHPQELQLLYDETVAPLVRYDERYRTDLLETLRAYLANNCNMNATAAAVLAHRHTIAYRLERIRELSGLDPSASEDRERLGLGLKAQRVIRAQLAR